MAAAPPRAGGDHGLLMENHCSADTYIQQSPESESARASLSSGETAVDGLTDSPSTPSRLSLSLPRSDARTGRLTSLDPNPIGIFKEYAQHRHSVICEIRRSLGLGSRISVHEVNKANRVDRPLWNCKPSATFGSDRVLYVSQEQEMVAVLSRDKQSKRWECREANETLPPTSLLPKKNRSTGSAGNLLFAVQFRPGRKSPHVELPINYASTQAGAPAVESLPLQLGSDRLASDWQVNTPWGRALAMVHRLMGFRTQATVHVAPFVDLFLPSMLAIAAMEEELLSDRGSEY